MQQTEYTSLEEYAEHIRREMGRVAAAARLRGATLAEERAVVLMCEAAAIVQAKKMQDAFTASDRYNLATLPAPAPLDPDADTQE